MKRTVSKLPTAKTMEALCSMKPTKVERYGLVEGYTKVSERYGRCEISYTVNSDNKVCTDVRVMFYIFDSFLGRHWWECTHYYKNLQGAKRGAKNLIKKHPNLDEIF